MKGNLFRGFAYLIQGFHIVCQPGLRLFLLVPLSVNILLFALLIIWFQSLFSGWMNYLLSWLPEWLAFLEWFFWGLYLIVILMTIFYGFVAAANLLGAPFYGYLAEMTEKRLSGQTADTAFSWKELIALIPRTVKREFQKLAYYLPRVLLLFLLSLIPVVNAFVAVLWILFSGWMMAIQYIDYPADNHQMTFPDMRRYLSEHRLSALGFGLLAFGVTLIPVLNLLALPASVCGAVAFWANEQKGATPFHNKQALTRAQQAIQDKS